MSDFFSTYKLGTEIATRNKKKTTKGATTPKASPAGITAQQYQMTSQEMMGGSAGQKAYTDRIAKLRGGTTTGGTGGTIQPPTPIAPPTPPTGGGGAGTGAGDVGTGTGAGGAGDTGGGDTGGGTPKVDPRDELIEKLTTALTKATEGDSLEEQRETLRDERGIEGMQEKIGTFDEEINKSFKMLDDLALSLRKGEEFEVDRNAPLFLQTGRQRALGVQASIQKQDILSTISTYQRGKESAQEAINREEADILTVLGMRDAANKQPLESLKTELELRSQIRDLTKKNIPDVVSSTYNDSGDLTIVTQNESGVYATKTIPGIGKKSSQYTSITSKTDEEGNLTFFGIDKSGNPQQLGSFEGVSAPSNESTEKDTKYISIKTSAGLDASMPVDINNITSNDIAKMKKGGLNDNDIRSWLDTNAKGLSKATKDGLLGVGDDVMGEFRDVFTQYKKAGWTKKEIIEYYGKENINAPIERLLDEVFN